MTLLVTLFRFRHAHVNLPKVGFEEYREPLNALQAAFRVRMRMDVSVNVVVSIGSH